MTNLKFKKNWGTADVKNKRSDCWRCFGISAIKSINSVRFGLNSQKLEPIPSLTGSLKLIESKLVEKSVIKKNINFLK